MESYFNRFHGALFLSAAFALLGVFFIGTPHAAAVSDEGTGTITVNLSVNPSSDSGRFDLQINGSIAGTGTDVGNGGTTGPVAESAGENTAGIVAEVGTSLSNYTATIGGDCNSDGTINLEIGQNAVCSITLNVLSNTPNTASLTIVKDTDNPLDNGTFNFTISNNNDPAITTVNGTGQANVQLEPGSYNVQEVVPSGWAFDSSSCSYADGGVGENIENGENISVDAGDNVTCTFHDIRPAGTLTVVKLLNGGPVGANPSDFQMHVEQNGADISGSPQPGNSYGTNYGNIETGAYVVSEQSVAGYTAQFSGDCDSSGNVTVNSDFGALCVVTNTYNGVGGYTPPSGGTPPPPSNPPTTPSGNPAPTTPASGSGPSVGVGIIPENGTLYLGNPFLAGAVLLPNGNETCSVQGTIVMNDFTCQNIVAAPGLQVQTMPTCQNPNFAVTLPSCTTNDTVLFAVGADPITTGPASVTFTNVTAQAPENLLSVQTAGGNYTVTAKPVTVPTTPAAPRYPQPTGGTPSSVPSGTMTGTTTPESGAGAGLVNTSASASGSGAWQGFLSWLGENFWWLALLIIILLLLFWIFARDDDDDENNKQNQNQNTNKNQQTPPNNQQQS